MDKRVNVLSSLSDAELAARAKEKNYEIIIEIERRYRQRVYWHLMKSVHDIVYAEEITDRTFDKAKENLENGKYKEENKFLNWLFRIARNIHLSDKRKKQKHPTFPLNEEIDFADVTEEESKEEASIEKAKLQLVGKALHECSQRQRVAFILKFVKGKEWLEVGKRLKSKPDSARRDAYRCLAHIKKLLANVDKTLTKNIFKKLSQNIPLLRYIIKRSIKNKNKNEKA